MTTRKSNKDSLLPLSDPEAILRAGNAERRRRIAARLIETAIHVPLPRSPTLQAAILPPRTITPPPFVPATSTTISELPSPFLKRPTMSNPADTSQSSKDDLSMSDCIKAMLAIQQTTVLQLQANQAQALADREATSARMARLEEIAINTSIKTEPGTNSEKPRCNRVDFQKFRFADGPSFTDSVAGYFEHLPKRFNGRLMHATGTPLERSTSPTSSVEELPGHFNYDSAAVEAVQIVGKDFPEDDDNSSFYPELSAADISAYRAIDTVTASVQGVVIADEDLSLIEHVSHGLASIAVNDEELNNIIDEELSLTKEDEHRLAIDEGSANPTTG
ncbi:hypothetical protein H4Q26_005196 [Puccinia striiformis f. sp. tritici PST-130]|nr:hypothetical protein H4Q26_005196 [Puccinia striiformis f. sp. tritici PST-130]